MRKIIISILIAVVFASAAHSQQLIYASATTGQTGQTIGAGISSTQFIGGRFELTSVAQITGIGGHFFTPPGSNGQMFGVLIQLDSLSSLPTGDPFDSTDLSRIVLSTVVTVSSSSSVDYIFPVSVTLQPGFYGIIFGKGLFGASSDGVVGAAQGENLSSTYMYWNDGNTPGWSNGGFPTARLTVYGVVPEPSGALLFILAAAILASVFRNKPA